MPYELSWEVEDHILMMKAVGDVSDTDFKDGINCLNDYLTNNSDQIIHLISDASEIGEYPQDMVHLGKIMTLIARRSNLGIIISIGKSNSTINFITKITSQVFLGKTIKSVENLDGALRTFRKYDATIPQ